MNARCWAAFEAVVPARAEPPRGNWFVTPDDDTFAFVEGVPAGEDAYSQWNIGCFWPAHGGASGFHGFTASLCPLGGLGDGVQCHPDVELVACRSEG